MKSMKKTKRRKRATRVPVNPSRQGTSFQNAILIEDDLVQVQQGPTPIIVISDDDDDPGLDTKIASNLIDATCNQQDINNSILPDDMEPDDMQMDIDFGTEKQDVKPVIEQEDVKPAIQARDLESSIQYPPERIPVGWDDDYFAENQPSKHVIQKSDVHSFVGQADTKTDICHSNNLKSDIDNSAEQSDMKCDIQGPTIKQNDAECDIQNAQEQGGMNIHDSTEQSDVKLDVDERKSDIRQSIEQNEMESDIHRSAEQDDMMSDSGRFTEKNDMKSDLHSSIENGDSEHYAMGSDITEPGNLQSSDQKDIKPDSDLAPDNEMLHTASQEMDYIGVNNRDQDQATISEDTKPVVHKELNYDIVRDTLQSAMPDYSAWSQQTRNFHICIFSSLETPFYFGFIHELPQSITLVFGCRDPTHNDIAFMVNVLFIRARFTALKLGSLPSIEQLVPFNPLLRYCLAHHPFIFDDEELAQSQTTRFIEVVQTLIAFLSIKNEVPKNVKRTDGTRMWFVNKTPATPFLCKICNSSEPDISHYSEHERDIWAKLSLDQRDQVFDLASARRRRIRSGVTILNTLQR